MNIVRRTVVDDSLLQGTIVDPILRQILARRGILRPEDLDTSLKGLLHYNQLQDIFVAADEIAKAIMAQHKIMIAGDYDIDGMSGTALGVRCLRAFGVPKENISFYVPSRYADGYGLSINAVEQALSNKVNLIITVDNGIAAFESVDYAMQHGIRVVVTDHHEIQDRLPNAVAVVDPKRKDDNFASKNLCGVGVLFYVMSAVRAKLVEYQYFKSRQEVPNMARFLDLVTLGTIGDVMALDSNNRRLVKSGLKQIKSLQCCPGLQALMRTLSLEPSKINLRSIAFDFCPRFNASTRIKIDENPAITNLLTDDITQATSSAQQLEMCNKRRTDYEKVMLAEALTQLEQVYSDDAAIKNEDFDERVGELVENDSTALPSDNQKLAQVSGIVLFGPTFLTGLVGLVANRIKERYGKPCVIFGADVGAGKDAVAEMFKQQAAEQPITSGLPGQAGLPSQLGQYASLYAKGEDAPESVGHINPYRMELAACQKNMSHSFLDNALGQSASVQGKSTAAGYERVVVKAQDLDEVLEDAIKVYSAPDCDKVVVGSARSIDGVDLMQVFNYIKQQAPDIFVACGGHALAAGASVRAKDIPRFRQLFNEACSHCMTEGSSQDSALITDGSLPATHLCLNFAKDLEVFGPWGKDYEEPKFDGVFTLESAQLIGNNRHLRMKLRNGLIIVDGIKFRANAKEKLLVDMAPLDVNVVYTMTVDRYYQERLQLNVEVIEPV